MENTYQAVDTLYIQLQLTNEQYQQKIQKLTNEHRKTISALEKELQEQLEFFMKKRKEFQSLYFGSASISDFIHFLPIECILIALSGMTTIIISAFGVGYKFGSKQKDNKK